MTHLAYGLSSSMTARGGKHMFTAETVDIPRGLLRRCAATLHEPSAAGASLLPFEDNYKSTLDFDEHSVGFCRKTEWAMLDGYLLQRRRLVRLSLARQWQQHLARLQQQRRRHLAVMQLGRQLRFLHRLCLRPPWMYCNASLVLCRRERPSRSSHHRHALPRARRPEYSAIVDDGGELAALNSGWSFFGPWPRCFEVVLESEHLPSSSSASDTACIICTVARQLTQS